MDVHDKATRSYNMSRIRSKDTGPEVRIRSLCHRQGLRFRKNVPELPGKPDIVFPKHKTVVFVNGCYWHIHTCPRGQVIPKTRTEFWQSKRLATVDRDEQKRQQLEYLGWRVMTLWECELDDEDALVGRIRKAFSI
jgi:DNA mismatch endonuclease, patch repair protein